MRLSWPTEPNVDVGAIRMTVKQSVARRSIGHLRQHAPHWLDRVRVTWPDGRVEHRFWQAGGGFDRNLWRPCATPVQWTRRRPG